MNARWTRWIPRFFGCILAAATITAFLVHLDAADPWFGGIALPATVWFAWIAIDSGVASLRRARQRRAARRG